MHYVYIFYTFDSQMPSLHWIGKEKVINHHLDVPFRVLVDNIVKGLNKAGFSSKDYKVVEEAKSVDILRTFTEVPQLFFNDDVTLDIDATRITVFDTRKEDTIILKDIEQTALKQNEDFEVFSVKPKCTELA